MQAWAVAVSCAAGAVISDTGSLAGEIVLATAVAVLPASNVN
jgi:hypothetical protein